MSGCNGIQPVIVMKPYVEMRAVLFLVHIHHLQVQAELGTEALQDEIQEHAQHWISIGCRDRGRDSGV